MSKISTKIIAIFALSFLLNFIWENIHSVLYYLPSNKEITQVILARSTFFDALFITLLAEIFIISKWWNKKLWLGFMTSIVCAVVVEKIALSTKEWAYTSAMPIIPFLNTGLSPTLQLAIIFYIIYKIFKIEQKTT